MMGPLKLEVVTLGFPLEHHSGVVTNKSHIRRETLLTQDHMRWP